MNRRTFLAVTSAAVLGSACRRVGIEDLTTRSPQSEIVLWLDEKIQGIAQRKIVEPLKATIINRRLPTGTDLAFVCLANETGDVLSYIPSRDETLGYDNCRFAMRDIASTVKLFVYAVALQSGAISADETFMDAPMEFRRLDGRGTYRADNYGSRYTMRALSIEEAIAISSNVIALQVYHRIKQDVLRAHLAALDLPTKYNPNFLPLGIYAIPPLVLASRTTLFARGGSYVLPRFINETRTTDNQKTQEPVRASQQIFRPDVCEVVSRAMQRCVASGTGAAAADLALRVRAKTGSSSDALCVMESRATTCALWIGDRSSNTDLRMSGGRLAAPLLADFYRELLKERAELIPIWN